MRSVTVKRKQAGSAGHQRNRKIITTEVPAATPTLLESRCASSPASCSPRGAPPQMPGLNDSRRPVRPKSPHATERRCVGRGPLSRIYFQRVMPAGSIVAIVRAVSSSRYQPMATPFSDIHRPCMLHRAVAYRVPGLAVFIERVISWCV